MIQLRKTIDEKFNDINFIKIKENEYGASYERFNAKYDFVQRIDLLYNANGNHLIQSYDKDLIDVEGIGNTCVGLMMYEIMLCVKKMKQMGWRCKRYDGI